MFNLILAAFRNYSSAFLEAEVSTSGKCKTQTDIVEQNI